MRGMVLSVGAALGVAVAAGGARAEVVITEIMYNPASHENPPATTEWVEVYNAGDAAVDLGGWWLQDEDGKTGPLPEGVTLEPGAAAVLIPGGCSVADFRAAWGAEVAAYPLENWGGRPGMSGLANAADAENEVLTLRDAAGTVVDEVNYQAASPWPSGARGGPSIYLLPALLNATANGDGSNWRYSEDGSHGGRHAQATERFDARDVGSPGVVATE